MAATVAGFLEPFGSTLTAARMIFVCGMSAWVKRYRFGQQGRRREARRHYIKTHGVGQRLVNRSCADLLPYVLA